VTNASLLSLTGGEGTGPESGHKKGRKDRSGTLACFISHLTKKGGEDQATAGGMVGKRSRPELSGNYSMLRTSYFMGGELKREEKRS